MGSIPVGRAISYRDVAQLGSALDLGSRGRRFKSCHPDHLAGQLSWLEHPVHTRKVVGSSPTPATIKWTLSAVGQSIRLITGGSQVRVLQGPPLLKFYIHGGILKWLKSPVLKTGRSGNWRLGSNPSSSAILKTQISRGRAAWLARRAHNPEVVGSNPSPATKDGPVAQLVEQRTENPCVAGSIPARTTIFKYKSNRKI